MPRSMRRVLEMMRSFALCTLSLTTALATIAGAQTGADSVRTPFGSVRAIERPYNVSRFDLPANNSALPVANLSQLLSGRFAGVQVLSGGATGTGSRIRIRGQSSMLLGNEPLIIVDGVRLVQTLNASTQMPSRVDDINVDDIARVEIINGPSGTTMYGSEAAHGVINITTKRGVAGKTAFRVYAENGIVNDANRYPDLWSRWGKQPGSTVSQICPLTQNPQTTCALDSLSHGHIMHIDSLKPVDIGFRSQYGLQASGGSQRLQYFVAGEREDETGVFKMPARDERRLELKRGVSSLPDEQVRPSALTRNSLRTNLSTQLGSKFRLDVSGAYVSGDIRLPPMSATIAGLGTAVQAGAWDLTRRTADGFPLAGYFFLPAGELMSQVTQFNNERLFGGLGAEFRPSKWLTMEGSYGEDRASQVLAEYVRGSDAPGLANPQGISLKRQHVRSSQRTFLASAIATSNPRPWLETRTVAGLQLTGSRDSSHQVTGSTLEQEPTTPNAAALSLSLFGTSRTTGVFVEQTLAVDGQFFVTAGARRDAVRIYQSPTTSAVYPTFGASWVLSSLQSLQHQRVVKSARVHAVYGESGQFGMPSDAISLSALPTDFAPGTTRPIAPGAYDADRRSEHSREWQAGVDASLFSSATLLDVVYFAKTTRNVFASHQVRPNPIGPAYTYAANAATVQNSGFEFSLRQRVLDRRAVSASVDVIGATNRNRMTYLRADVLPIFAGNRSTIKSTQNAPLFGFWGRTYTYNDVNRDNRITANELTFSDTAEFFGSSIPTRLLTVSPRVELFGKKLRVSAQIDSKWGHRKFNNTLRHQCQSARSCRAVNVADAPLEAQAAEVALSSGGALSGFFEDASFTRLREASIDVDLPARWIRSLRGDAWSLALVGRNLGVITRYSGVDPESTIGTTDTDTDEYFNTPPMRYFTLRLNVKF